MAITSAIATSFKQELLVEGHNLTNGADTLKLALYTSSATLGAGGRGYVTTGQATGTNYTAGGSALTNVTPTTSGTTAIVDFADLTFGTATVTARGCLIYNTSNSNKAICAIDFGGDKTSTAGDFTVVFPAATATGAIIRLA
jgi:VCBS repeat-containing protein